MHFWGVNGRGQIMSHKSKLKCFSNATRSRSSLIEFMKHLANIPSLTWQLMICEMAWFSRNPWLNLWWWVSTNKVCFTWLLYNTKGRRPAGPHWVCVCLTVSRNHAVFLLYHYTIRSWWRHQLETFSSLLPLCTGNSPVSGEFPTQRPVTRSFDVFFDLRLIKRLSKHSRGWWLRGYQRLHRWSLGMDK